MTSNLKNKGSSTSQNKNSSRTTKDKLSFSNLKIKKSYVTTIKSEVKKYIKIGELLLDGNSFGDSGVKLICSSLKYSNIKTINLSNNNLTE